MRSMSWLAGMLLTNLAYANWCRSHLTALRDVIYASPALAPAPPSDVMANIALNGIRVQCVPLELL